MKRVIPFLLLVFVAVACDSDGPTVPIDGPQFAVDCENPKFADHPQCTGGGGGDEETVEYSFIFPETWEAAEALEGDCRWPHWEEGYEDNPEEHPENPYGRTWRCPVGGNPILAFQVVDGNGDPVGGTVTFLRCEDEAGVPQLWTKCGVRQRGKPKYHANQYAVEDVLNGIVGVTLYEIDRVVWYDYPIQGEVYGWGGMKWNYESGDGGKADLGSNWFNVMPPYEGS